ncbi:MAG: DoxX family protein [Pseudomonadota bacterium]
MATYTPTLSQTGFGSGAIDKLAPYGLVLGRALLASLFLISGANKIAAFDAIQAYMAAFGVPAELLSAVIAFQLTAGFALLVGFGARIAAFLLAGFSVMTALVFHLDFADQIQTIMFTKNIAVAGGLFVISAGGPGPLSLNRRY